MVLSTETGVADGFHITRRMNKTNKTTVCTILLLHLYGAEQFNNKRRTVENAYLACWSDSQLSHSLTKQTKVIWIDT